MSTPAEQADAVERAARGRHRMAKSFGEKSAAANLFGAHARVFTEAAATLRRVPAMEAQIARLREALGFFMGEDDKVQVGVGGNPYYVGRKLTEIRTLMDRAALAQDIDV